MYGTFFTYHINLRHRQYGSLKDSFDVLDMAEDITKNSPLKKDYKYLHTAEILNLKGEANLELGKRNRAEHILADAVRIFETQPQLEKLSSTAKLKCFYNYADALSKNGKTQKAKEYYIKSLEISTKDEGIEGNHWRDPRKISLPLIYAENCCLILGDMSKAEGNNEEAKQYLQKGIDIVKKYDEATEATKYKLGVLSIEMANILKSEGKTEEARNLLITNVLRYYNSYEWGYDWLKKKEDNEQDVIKSQSFDELIESSKKKLAEDKYEIQHTAVADAFFRATNASRYHGEVNRPVLLCRKALNIIKKSDFPADDKQKLINYSYLEIAAKLRRAGKINEAKNLLLDNLLFHTYDSGALRDKDAQTVLKIAGELYYEPHKSVMHEYLGLGMHFAGEVWKWEKAFKLPLWEMEGLAEDQ